MMGHLRPVAMWHFKKHVAWWISTTNFFFFFFVASLQESIPGLLHRSPACYPVSNRASSLGKPSKREAIVPGGHLPGHKQKKRILPDTVGKTLKNYIVSKYCLTSEKYTNYDSICTCLFSNCRSEKFQLV